MSHLPRTPRAHEAVQPLGQQRRPFGRHRCDPPAAPSLVDGGGSERGLSGVSTCFLSSEWCFPVFQVV